MVQLCQTEVHDLVRDPLPLDGPRMRSNRIRPNRFLAIATAVVFCISTVFPVVAALGGAAALPRAVGIADGILAFVLVFMAMALFVRTQGKVTKDARDAAYHGYRVSMHLILGLLVAFFLFGDRIAWNIGLVGLAWRAWLLLYTLPAWYTALRSTG
jgi:hypothetical protein